MTIMMLNMMTICSRSGAVVLVTGKQEAGINLGEILERWIFTILLLIIKHSSHDQKNDRINIGSSQRLCLVSLSPQLKIKSHHIFTPLRNMGRSFSSNKMMFLTYYFISVFVDKNVLMILRSMEWWKVKLVTGRASILPRFII